MHTHTVSMIYDSIAYSWLALDLVGPKMTVGKKYLWSKVWASGVWLETTN